MKAFIIFLAIFVSFSYQEEFTDVLNTYSTIAKLGEEKCIKESNVDPELAKTLVSSGAFPDDRNLKCYTKCLFVNRGILDANDQIVDANLRSYVGVSDQAIAEKVFQKCKGLREADVCETVYEISKCIYRGVQEALKNA